MLLSYIAHWIILEKDEIINEFTRNYMFFSLKRNNLRVISYIMNNKNNKFDK